jgi:hypothetical protein
MDLFAYDCANLVLALHSLRSASDLESILVLHDRLSRSTFASVASFARIQQIVSRSILAFYDRRMNNVQREKLAELGKINHLLLTWCDSSVRRAVIARMVSWQDMPPTMVAYFPHLSLQLKLSVRNPMLPEPQFRTFLYQALHDARYKPASLDLSLTPVDPLLCRMLACVLFNRRKLRFSNLEKETRIVSAFSKYHTSVLRWHRVNVGLTAGLDPFLERAALLCEQQFGAYAERLYTQFTTIVQSFFSENADTPKLADLIEQYLSPAADVHPVDRILVTFVQIAVRLWLNTVTVLITEKRDRALDAKHIAHEIDLLQQWSANLPAHTRDVFAKHDALEECERIWKLLSDPANGSAVGLPNYELWVKLAKQK